MRRLFIDGFLAVLFAIFALPTETIKVEKFLEEAHTETMSHIVVPTHLETLPKSKTRKRSNAASTYYGYFYNYYLNDDYNYYFSDDYNYYFYDDYNYYFYDDYAVTDDFASTDDVGSDDFYYRFHDDFSVRKSPEPSAEPTSVLDDLSSGDDFSTGSAYAYAQFYSSGNCGEEKVLKSISFIL